MNVITINDFMAFTIAVSLLLGGKVITLRAPVLQRNSIPEPVVGGVLCAAVVGLVYALTGRQIVFELDARDFLLLMFFSSIGLNADLRSLLRGGRPLLVLLALACVFMLMQNVLGVAIASAFSLSPLAGLMAGSISLTGGVGTTLAWAPILQSQGLHNAAEIGLAANTIGLVAACTIGGPMAAWLIRRNGLKSSGTRSLDIGASSANDAAFSHFSVLWAIFVINITIMAGMALHSLIAGAGVTLPAFVSCLVVGILIRNLTPPSLTRRMTRNWPGVRRAMALVSDIALGLFLTMALMGLQLWRLDGSFAFITTVLLGQILLTVIWTLVVVFRAMGSDYEAAVISSGFGGITLGSTATAIANMTAVTARYGAAHQAFVIVPLVCGFFIDLVNTGVISAFVRVLAP